MRCSKCLNDFTVRNISFDKNGVCNYCNDFEKIKGKLEDKNGLNELFVERIEKVRSKYSYDVCLGISGGKDSLFVLDQLIKKYNLKVKTFTMNNGFLSKEAKKNIDEIVKEYKVDHEYIEFDKGLLKRVYHYSMKHWLVPCIACSYIGYAAMINYGTKINAGMCIHGRSPEQMLRLYGKDVFTMLVDMGLKHIDEIDLNSMYTDLLDSIKDKVDEEILNDIKSIAFNGMKKIEFREFVPYFIYHDYDEKSIVNYLKENTNWNPPTEYNHYDCEIHNATKYIYQCVEGRPHRLPEISALIRMNLISREQGMKMLEDEQMQIKPKDELKKICSFANIKQAPLLMKAKIYKSYKKVVNK